MILMQEIDGAIRGRYATPTDRVFEIWNRGEY
jgi:hypothetical protein